MISSGESSSVWVSLFVGEFTDVLSSLTGFKASMRKSKADLEVLSFDKEITIVCLSVCLYACKYVPKYTGTQDITQYEIKII